MDIHSILEACEGFLWDEGNSSKSWLKHRVAERETEEVFFNEPLMLVADMAHSQNEARFRAMDYTDNDRYLFVVFMVRAKLIRIISARDMNRRERVIYEKFKASAKI